MCVATCSVGFDSQFCQFVGKFRFVYKNDDLAMSPRRVRRIRVYGRHAIQKQMHIADRYHCIVYSRFKNIMAKLTHFHYSFILVSGFVCGGMIHVL